MHSTFIVNIIANVRQEKVAFLFIRGELSPCFLIQDEKGNRFFVLPSGKRVKAQNDRVICLYSRKVAYDAPSIKKTLSEILQKVRDLSQQIDDQLLWEALLEEGEKTLDEIAELYYGEKTEDERKAALALRLAESPYFRRKSDLYIARTKEEIEEYLKKTEAERRKREEVEEFLNYVKAKKEGKEAEKTPAVEKFIELLREYAINEGNIKERTLIRELMENLGIRNIAGLFQFLNFLGEWQPEEEPLFYRLKVRRDFPEEVEREAASITVEENPPLYEADAIFSIDDEETFEVDDAISLKQTPEGFELGIHIADPSPYIKKGSLLDEEAFRRVQTIYLPEERIFMLPEALIERALTLSPERPARVLSLIVRLNQDLQITETRFSSHMLRLHSRHTYEESDQLFQDKLKPIEDFAKILQERRKARGAIVVNFPELKIKVKGEEIEIKKYEMNKKGHMVVQELMIFFNATAAELLAHKKIPAIYKTQPFTLSEIPQVDPEDPLFPLKIGPYLKTSHLSSEPNPHFTLGVNAYVQATSPIRRYSDVLIQRQILAALGQGQPDELEELKEKFFQLEEKTKLLRELMKSRKFYWLLKFFSMNRGMKVVGIYSRYREGRHFVYLPDYLIELPVLLPFSRPQREGRRMIFAIDRVNLVLRKLYLKPLYLK